MSFEEKISFGITYLLRHTVPEGSNIAMEVNKIAKRLRVKKAEMNYYRAAVYYGWRKIKYGFEDLKNQDSDPMDEHENYSTPSDHNSI